MAEKKFFTDESLEIFVDKIKSYAEDADSTHNTSTDAHSNMGWLTSEDEVVSEPTPIDADTLGGHDASYFATQEDVSVERAKIDKLSNELDAKADSDHTHNDLYYTQTEIDSFGFITIDDIDAIIGATVPTYSGEVEVV